MQTLNAKGDCFQRDELLSGAASRLRVSVTMTPTARHPMVVSWSQPHAHLLLAITMQPNRDRGRPHDLPPPTPPDIRVTSPAVRWRQSAVGAAMEAWQTQAVEVAARQGDRQGRATA